MPKIHQLSPSLIAQIAAGEVVDRPASIIKELVENAIDAQATEIAVELIESGLDTIRVIDNGVGMDETDLGLCFLPHTTSKLNESNQLSGITTLGFRGEALASLAAVSQLTISTKPTNDISGYQLTITHGNPSEIQPLGLPNGTEVEVTQLFAQLPARHKFLKSPATELKQILKMMSQFVLAYPEIAFNLKNNQKLILDAPHYQTFLDRLENIVGTEFRQNSLPVTTTNETYQLAGFISPPSLSRESNLHHYFFINHRPVQPSFILPLIKQVYGGLLEPASQPLFVLNLTLPEHFVDVNVHPQKTQVALADQSTVFQFVQTTLEQVLHQYDLTFQSQLRLKDKNNFSYTADLNRDKKTHQPLHQALKSVVKAWETTHSRSQTEVLQLHDLYLVTQTDQGMLIVDQHAAHERILYEQFLAEFQHQNQQSSQFLPKPVLLSFAVTDAELLTEHLSLFADMGIIIEPFGKAQFSVTHLPPRVEADRVKDLLTEWLDDIANETTLRSVDTLTKKTLSFLACRTAIKQGDALSQEERQNLLKKLAETHHNETCPHGRPTQFILTKKELEKLFHRRK